MNIVEDQRYIKMQYNNEEIIEAIEGKKKQWIAENLMQILAEKGFSITDEEFQWILENTLKFVMNPVPEGQGSPGSE